MPPEGGEKGVTSVLPHAGPTESTFAFCGIYANKNGFFLRKGLKPSLYARRPLPYASIQRSPWA